jgi:hypothetical protein
MTMKAPQPLGAMCCSAGADAETDVRVQQFSISDAAFLPRCARTRSALRMLQLVVDERSAPHGPSRQPGASKEAALHLLCGVAKDA